MFWLVTAISAAALLFLMVDCLQRTRALPHAFSIAGVLINAVISTINLWRGIDPTLAMLGWVVCALCALTSATMLMERLRRAEKELAARPTPWATPRVSEREVTP